MKNLAILSFLLSFILVSCGDDSSSSANEFNEDSELSSSSSEKANKSSKSSSSSEKNKSSSSSSKKSEKNTENPPKLISTTISGMAQGPFEKGATVSVYELDENFETTGNSIKSKTTNDRGEFSIKIKDFKSQYALLKVEGNLLDICTVEKTANKTTLYAVADLSTPKTNINILTHLAHKRALYLVTKKNMTVAKAQKQAETEVLKSFGIDEDLGATEELDIFVEDKKSSALITISALMQGDLSNRGVKDLLTTYISDIEKDGTWDDEKSITKIADWAYERDNKFWSLFEKGLLFPIDNYSFVKYMDNFWQQKYGIGNCTKKRENEVKKNNNPISGHANIYFICKAQIWTIAKKEEIYPDTLHIDTTASEGDLYWDKEYSVCYVYEDSLWIKINKTNCKIGLSGCTKLRKNDAEQDSDNQWYICDGKEWISMNDYETIKEKGLLFEKDIQNWKDTTEGTLRKGDITDIIYIFDNKNWRVATLPEASLGLCNEKNQNFFGYAEERKMQDLTDPRTNKCTEPYSSYCYHANYHPDFYICQKDYDNKFYWERLDAFGYDYICNDSSYYANNNDIHWGGIDPIKCVNCKQEIFDYFENICKKQCYKGRFTMNVLKCATDFDDCTESLLGTIEEGPTIKSKTEIEYLHDERYRYHSYVTSIDSTNKTTYICRIRYIGYNYETSYIKPHPSYQWDVASDFDLDAIPTICSWDIDGQIVVGKKNTYICEDERLRLATPVEIDAGFACTIYMRDNGNCKGEIISGKSNNKYVCDELGFRDATQEEIETGIACSSCIIISGLSCNTEMEKEFGKTCTELKSIVEKCRANE